jgi:uncharacterized phage protein gp47/JayE
MSGAYQTFDTLFAAMLTAYQNAGDGTTITVGDEFYKRAAALGSCGWGLYQEAAWTKDQIFPDTASEANLLHWGSVYELTKNDGETYAAFLARLLKRIRNKVSGGNLTDYENWAMACAYGTEVPSSVSVFGGTDAYGPGTLVEVVSVASGTPSSELLAVIKADALTRGPVSPAQVYVLSAAETDITVTLTMTGGDTALTKSYIQSFLSALEVGQAVYPEVFVAFAYQTGATKVTLTAPTSLTTPDKFGKVVASSITVTST